MSGSFSDLHLLLILLLLHFRNVFAFRVLKNDKHPHDCSTHVCSMEYFQNIWTRLFLPGLHILTKNMAVSHFKVKMGLLVLVNWKPKCEITLSSTNQILCNIFHIFFLLTYFPSITTSCCK